MGSAHSLICGRQLGAHCCPDGREQALAEMLGLQHEDLATLGHCPTPEATVG